MAINHVVVLMLENRSFDGMLGNLYPKSAAFDGLSGAESNPQSDPTQPPFQAWNRPGLDPASMTIPDPDPGELFTDMNEQLFGYGAPATGVPSMSGFVTNYARQQGVTPDPSAVMHHFTPDQVPVLSGLAKAFGVSDRWHASTPCQTWPNRFFVHTATAGGWVNNDPPHFPYVMPSIFDRLNGKQSWRVYFHDVPQSATLATVWEAGPTNFRLFEAAFAGDAASGDLPSYSFIEPRYFSSNLLQLIANDAHPPHNVHYAEQLVATVYNALRAGPKWLETLLIVTCDEHGGSYDHVPPPPAVPPSTPAPGAEFAFDRYGVRVPAIIVSPFVKPGSIIRPPLASLYPFDHTSIIATLRQLFPIGGALTARDAAAPDLTHVLDGPPDNLGPPSITPPDRQPTTAEIAGIVALPPNDMQHALCRLAAHLPAPSDDIPAYIRNLAQNPLPEFTRLPSVADATQFVSARINAFLGLV